MALPDVVNEQPATATLADWLVFWSPVDTLARVRWVVGRRLLQRRAQRQLARGQACELVRLVAAGDWPAVERLVEALEAA